MNKQPFFKPNPLVLLFFNLYLPTSMLILSSMKLHFFFLGYAFLILFLMKDMKRIIGFALYYGAMFALQSWITITNFFQGFISSMLMIGLNFMPCVMVATVLMFDYSASELLSSLEKLHLPRMFIISLTVTLRYIPTFRREFSLIKESMRIRGIDYQLKKPIKSFEFFIVPQLFRCLLLAEELTAAGMVKGISAPIKRTSYHDSRLHLLDWLLMLLLLLGNTGVVYV